MTTFNANEAIKTCADNTGDENNSAVNAIHLRFNAEGEARLEATDSYRAVRIALPIDAGAFNDAIQGAGGAKWVPMKGQPLTWESFKHYAEPSTRGIHRFDEIFIGVDGCEHAFRVTPTKHRTDITDFGYFDGERRRPQGIVELWLEQMIPDKLELFYRRGMRVFGDQRVRSFIAWEEAVTMLAYLDCPKGFEVGDTKDRLGVYSAKYLGPIDRAFRLGWTGPRKPLAFETHSSMYEHLVMPIRMPS